MKVQRSCVAAVAAAFFALTGSAAAAVTSQITTPSTDPYVAFLSGDDPTLMVAGTAAGTSTVDIRCYTDNGFWTLAAGVTVSGGNFSTTVHGFDLPPNGCELRAADPNDNSTNHGPSRAGDPYAGIYLRLSRAINVNFLSSGNVFSDFDVIANGPAGLFDIESASSGIDVSTVYDVAKSPSEQLFDRAGALFLTNFAETRSGIRIDGADAYGAETAAEIAQIQNSGNPLPGQPAVTVTQTVDPQTGAATIDDSEPIVKCSGTSSCTSFVSTGVALETTWTTSHNGLLAVQNSKWVATDGRSHALDALYAFGADSESDPVTPASFKFPGESDYAQHGGGDTVSLASGPNVYLYKGNANVVAAGDGHTPMGAFAYSSTPSGALAFAPWAGAPGYTWVIPYQRTIPASGGLTLSFAYAQGFAIADAQALAQGAAASFPPETVPPSPGGGTTPPPGSGTNPPPQPKPPVLALVGKPKARHGKVTLKLSCTGTSGACGALAKLTSGRKTYASVRKSLAVGKTLTVTLRLNSEGRRTLRKARHHRLKLKLTVQQTSPGAVRTLKTSRLVVKR
jgi:hypothetical protein